MITGTEDIKSTMVIDIKIFYSLIQIKPAVPDQ